MENAYVFSALFISVIIALASIIIAVASVSRIKRIRKECEAEKMIDAESAMGNLRFFKYHFENKINDSTRCAYHVAYIILDSNYLRTYYGENAFGNALSHTVSVLTDNLKENELSARITENGFILAFRAQSEDEARKRIENTMSMLNDFENVNKDGAKTVFYSAVYHLTKEDKNSEILLFNLRKNCNKIFGTEQQIIFCDTQSMNVAEEEKRITENILQGLEKKEFKMYLQFIVDNKAKKIISAEALSRWDSEDGLMGPGRYISDMESTGLISKHDFYMFELACRQLEKWSETEYKEFSISCNFTRITLSEKDFIETIKAISDKYSFDKSKLAIEITEDAIEKDMKTAMKNVMQCKELGFKVYLDDMGCGYTSLGNLCDYPIDVVKLDRDILLKTESGKGKELFSGIIALAHNLNIKVVCEGVETKEQEKLVSSTDCDFIQGWYYSTPLPLEECEMFIKEFKVCDN